MARVIVEVDEDHAHELEMSNLRQLVRDMTAPELNDRLERGPVEIANGVRVLAKRSTSEGLTVKISRGNRSQQLDEPPSIEAQAEQARAGMRVAKEDDNG